MRKLLSEVRGVCEAPIVAPDQSLDFFSGRNPEASQSIAPVLDWWSQMVHWHSAWGVLKKEHIIPRDLINGRTSDEVRALTQRLVFRFRQLLSWWLEIVEVATHLRAQGERLASRIEGAESAQEDDSILADLVR